MGRVIVFVISILIATTGILLTDHYKMEQSSKEIVLPPNKDVLPSPSSDKTIGTINEDKDEFITYNKTYISTEALSDLVLYINGNPEGRSVQMCESFCPSCCCTSDCKWPDGYGYGYSLKRHPIWDERFYNAKISNVKVNGKKSRKLLMIKLSHRISRYKESYRYFFFKRESDGYLTEVGCLTLYNKDSDLPAPEIIKDKIEGMLIILTEGRFEPPPLSDPAYRKLEIPT